MQTTYDVDELIAKIGDPILRSVASPVRAFDQAVEALLSDMLEVAVRVGAAGLAAPQIGVLRRVVVVLGGEEALALVNPVVIEASEETDVAVESCLSLPGIALQVERPITVRVEAQDMTGESDVIEVEGYGARVLQHEMDHLDGKMIIDHVDRAERGAALAALRYGRTYPPQQHQPR